MNIKRRITYFFLLTALSFAKANACDINYQLLGPRAGNLSSRILSGEVIPSDSIVGKLDFIPYDRKPIACDPQKFLALIEKAQSTIEEAVEKLGHNRYRIFVDDCQTLFRGGELDDKERFALYVLFDHVQQRINRALSNLDTAVEPDSRMPDGQFSFLFDSGREKSRSSSAQSETSMHHPVCESASEDSEHKPKTPHKLDDVTFTFVSLDTRALQPSTNCAQNTYILNCTN